MKWATENKSRSIKHLTICIGFLMVSLSMTGCGKGKEANDEAVARFIKSAEVYRDQGQYRAAILEAKNAIQKNPEDAQGYAALAGIYNTLGAYGGTQSLLQPLADKMPELSLLLSAAYIETGKYRSAINLLNNYNAEKTSSGDSYRKEYLLARCYILLGDKEAFDKSLKALGASKDNDIKVALLMSEFLISQGQHEAALEKLESIQAPEGEAGVDVLLAKGNLYLLKNDLAKSEDLYTKALGLLPNTDILSAKKLAVLGQLTESLIRQGKSGEAYRYQKLISDANPEGNAAKEKFNDAMEFFRQGKFSEAEKVLKELREQFPQDKNSAILLGLVEYQRGRDKQATDLFDQYIDPETSTVSVIQAAALAKMRVNKMDDAVALLKKSVESQPQNAEILATYGLALLDRDKTSVEGQKALEKSLAINPKQQRLRLALAKRDFEMGNSGLGLGQLQKAYDEQPMDLLIQQSYFKALFNEGKLDVIKSEIIKFQKNNPGNPRGSFLDGWFSLVQKKYGDAEQFFKKAIAVKDNTEKNLAYAGLAEVYKSQNQLPKAAEVFESMLEADPSRANLYEEWLNIQMQANRVNEAIAFLSKLENKAESWVPSVVLAQVMLNQGQISDAIRHIDTALSKGGNSEQAKKIAANIYQRYGVKLVNENKSPEAKNYILKALMFDPNNMNILASLIELEILNKNPAEAQKLLEQYAASNQGSAEHDYLQGVIKDSQNQQDDALALYKRSWEKSPLEVTAKAIASHYQKTNQNQALFAFVDEWSAKIPNSPEAALLMAIKAQQNNDKATAVKWYEKNISLNPDGAVPLNNLAWLYYELKNPKAQSLAERAYRLDPKNPSIIDTYGWILVESGQVREGIELLQNAATIAPTSKEIKEHLDEAKKRLKK